MAKRKRTNNDLQNTAQKTIKIEIHESHIKKTEIELRCSGRVIISCITSV
jgi:hypothetical protein